MRFANEDNDHQPGGPKTELRRTPRSRTLLGAKIIFSDGSCSFGCAVRDITDGGARIALPPDQIVPTRFYLITSRHEVAFDAETVWRHGALLGVKFHGKLDLSAPQLRFVKRLADELRPRPESRSVPHAPCE